MLLLGPCPDEALAGSRLALTVTLLCGVNADHSIHENSLPVCPTAGPPLLVPFSLVKLSGTAGTRVRQLCRVQCHDNGSTPVDGNVQ